MKLMLLRGYAFNSTADFHTLQEIKEKLCYVALVRFRCYRPLTCRCSRIRLLDTLQDPTKENALAEETTVVMEKYTLPDGRDITIGAERFLGPEALFSPGMIDVESAGMSDMVYDMIMDPLTAIDMRPEVRCIV